MWAPVDAPRGATGKAIVTAAGGVKREVGTFTETAVHTAFAPAGSPCETMTVRIISRRTLREFVASRVGYRDHPALKASLDAWFAEVSSAEWRTTADVKRRHATASIVDAERVVFNIKGNDYRLIVTESFDLAIVWIKWIGTHRDYDGVDARTVEYGD